MWLFKKHNLHFNPLQSLYLNFDSETWNDYLCDLQLANLNMSFCVLMEINIESVHLLCT